MLTVKILVGVCKLQTAGTGLARKAVADLDCRGRSDQGDRLTTIYEIIPSCLRRGFDQMRSWSALAQFLPGE